MTNTKYDIYTDHFHWYCIDINGNYDVGRANGYGITIDVVDMDGDGFSYSIHNKHSKALLKKGELPFDFRLSNEDKILLRSNSHGDERVDVDDMNVWEEVLAKLDIEAIRLARIGAGAPPPPKHPVKTSPSNPSKANSSKTNLDGSMSKLVADLQRISRLSAQYS